MITNFERNILLDSLAAYGVPAGSHAYDSHHDCIVQITTEFEIDDTRGILVMVSSEQGEYWIKPRWLKPLQADIQFVEVEGE